MATLSSEKIFKTRIVIRHDTYANLKSHKLKAGEFAWASDLNILKVGNGDGTDGKTFAELPVLNPALYGLTTADGTVSITIPTGGKVLLSVAEKSGEVSESSYTLGTETLGDTTKSDSGVTTTTYSSTKLATEAGVTTYVTEVIKAAGTAVDKNNIAIGNSTGTGVKASGFVLGTDSDAILTGSAENTAATEVAVKTAITTAVPTTADNKDYVIVGGANANTVAASAVKVGGTSSVLNSTTSADTLKVQLATEAGVKATAEGVVPLSAASDNVSIVTVGTTAHTVQDSGYDIESAAADVHAVNTTDSSYGTVVASQATVAKSVQAAVAVGTDDANEIVVVSNNYKVIGSGKKFEGSAASLLNASAADGYSADIAAATVTSQATVEATVEAAVTTAALGASEAAKVVVSTSTAHSVASSSYTLGGAALAKASDGTYSDTTLATEKAVEAAINDKIAAADALRLKGSVSSWSTLTALTDVEAGDCYKVTATITAAEGVPACEVGDMVIASSEAASGADAGWFVVQSNIDKVSSSAFGYVNAYADTEDEGTVTISAANKILHGGTDGGTWSQVATADIADKAITLAKMADKSVDLASTEVYQTQYIVIDGGSADDYASGTTYPDSENATSFSS